MENARYIMSLCVGLSRAKSGLLPIGHLHPDIDRLGKEKSHLSQEKTTLV